MKTGTASPQCLELRAGEISMMYENGNIRYIRTGKIEILRMIHPSVRGKGWITIDPEIADEKFSVSNDSFKISYNAMYSSGEINFLARISAEGFSDNSLVLNFEGEAIDSFEKNRIGFCVLHPADYAGRKCTIIHTNGEFHTTEFPELIDPWQPFTDIRSMRWLIDDGLECILDFDGDVFETEDHRNWTDSSFKTYCTPLSLPYPVRLVKGQKINQRISFRIIGNFKAGIRKSTSINITISPEISAPLPLIGICQSTRPQEMTDSEASIIKKLKFSHYRTDLFLSEPGWKIRAELSLIESRKIDVPLELAIFTGDNFSIQIKDLIEWISANKPQIEFINIFHRDYHATPEIVMNTCGAAIREAFPGIKISAGTNANFAQVNRSRYNSAFTEYMSYSIHPQEHAGDDMTLIENLQAQSSTVETSYNFGNGRKILVSPVNIQRRFNANVENYEHPHALSSCPPQVDKRLMTVFGGAWTAGSLKYLGESKCHAVTYFETAGERGIFQGDYPSRWPEEFPSEAGMIFPVFHVFSFISECRSFNVIRSRSSDPLKVESLVLSDGKSVRMILSNFTPETQEPTIDCQLEFSRLHKKNLNQENLDKWANDPDWLNNTATELIDADLIRLEPFSITFIDGCFKDQDICK